MARPDSNMGMFAGVAVVLMIAIGALATFQFNMLGVRDWLMSHEENGRDPITRNSGDGGPVGGGGATGGATFTPEPPKKDYTVQHPKELPKRLTIQRKAGGSIIELHMLLVPQGWTIMGENDGVRANMPKRWVWLDDYYLAETEVTNEQYYAFVLGRGYEDAQHWSPTGFKDLGEGRNIRGSYYIGWNPINEALRMWALASPGRDVTIEVKDAQRNFGAPDCRMLVLPRGGAWTDWLWLNPQTGRVHLKDYSGQWYESSGSDPALLDKARAAKLLHKADAEGRLTLSELGERFDVIVVAWADGDNETPQIGYVKRDEDHRLRAANMPVVGVSWFEADACARFFGGNLPTEAQWEKAARGAKGNRFPWGNDLDWTLTIEDSGKRTTTPQANVNRTRVMPVASFAADKGAWGHLDLAGNVSEWCGDTYLEHPDWAEANPYNRGNDRSRRSERGSNHQDDDCFPAWYRRSSDAYQRGNMPRGFRIAMKPADALRLAGQ